MEFDPGAKFRYNNSGYFIPGAIIEQVDGKPYEQVLRERIFEPLGMKASGYDRSAPILEKRARGYEQGLAGVRNTDYLDMSLPYSAGSLYSTVEDLYVWDQALYGEKVLPSRAKELMFTIHATSDIPQIGDYGYGWGIRKRSIGPGNAERVTIGHGGGINGFNTLITRVPCSGPAAGRFARLSCRRSAAKRPARAGSTVWRSSARGSAASEFSGGA